MAVLTSIPLFGRQFRPGRTFAIALISAFCFAEACVARADSAQKPGSIEYQVKAAMLYNFTRFISWPDETGPTLKLCIAGDDPFGSALAAIDGETVDARTLAVTREADIGSLEQCQLVFVSRSLDHMLPKILQELADRPVVTIGESPGFVGQGGTIGLTLVEGKVRFDINAEGVEQHGLRFSSKLLRLARRVGSGRTQ